MKDDFDTLVRELSTHSVSIDVVHNLSILIKQQNIESLASFVSKSFQFLLILEKWSWQLLSEDTLQWINESEYVDLLHALASFNHCLIFDCDTIDNDSKIALFLPESIDQINRIFQHIERNNDDNSPYLVIINRIFNNQSTFLLDHLQYSSIGIIDHIGEYFVRNYIMTKQFKDYLLEFQQSHKSQTQITAKMLFYMKTCSFYFYVYLAARFQNFFYTSVETMRYLGDDCLRIIHAHVPMIAQWNKEFLACIAHLTALLCRCVWWGGEMALPIKLLLPTEQIACQFVQDLMQLIAYAPFYNEIKFQRSNDETVLLEASIFIILDIAETQDINWLFRANTSYQKSLLSVAETGLNDIICLGAYDIMSVVLADEQIKELKMSDGATHLAFNMLEQAWHAPTKMYKQIPIVNILQGILNLSKNGSVQQNIAHLTKIPVFLEMCDDYSIVYDILWSLSFNQNIQQQLRANTSFMSKLAHLSKEYDNKKTRKIIHGLLWNLKSHSETDSILSNNNEETFDLMISYSHKDKELCKQLYDELIKVGYRVWIDFDQMHGNIMDAMAQAIERSQTVILCISEDYRKSNYCRAEAQYAFQRQRKIVPVLLQKHYKPDGWLLFLIGQYLYVDFTEHEFSQAMEMLRNELRASHISETNLLSTSSKKNVNMPTPIPPVLQLKPSVLPMLSQKMVDWTSADVQRWLVGNKLVQMARLLAHCDGQSLIYLRKYMKHSETRHILGSFREDSFRRLNENLSLIELSRFQTLIDKQHLHL